MLPPPSPSRSTVLPSLVVCALCGPGRGNRGALRRVAPHRAAGRTFLRSEHPPDVGAFTQNPPTSVRSSDVEDGGDLEAGSQARRLKWIGSARAAETHRMPRMKNSAWNGAKEKEIPTRKTDRQSTR